MRNAISIDLEDWFCAGNLSEMTPYGSWKDSELRVEASTRRLLALLDGHGVKATFFVLGWIALIAAAVSSSLCSRWLQFVDRIASCQPRPTTPNFAWAAISCALFSPVSFPTKYAAVDACIDHVG